MFLVNCKIIIIRGEKNISIVLNYFINIIICFIEIYGLVLVVVSHSCSDLIILRENVNQSPTHIH